MILPIDENVLIRMQREYEEKATRAKIETPEMTAGAWYDGAAHAIANVRQIIAIKQGRNDGADC